MARIIYRKKDNSGREVNYIAGQVAFVNESRGEYEGMVVNLSFSLETYNNETKQTQKSYLSVAFWNSEHGNLADNVRKGKLHSGSFCIVKCGELREAAPTASGVPRYDATGFQYTYSFFNLGEETLLCGVARQVNTPDKDTFRFAIPVRNRDGDTVWHSVTFKDKLAHRAGKAGVKLGTPICVLAGPVKKTEKDGKTYHDVLAKDFVMGYPKDDE